MPTAQPSPRLLREHPAVTFQIASAFCDSAAALPSDCHRNGLICTRGCRPRSPRQAGTGWRKPGLGLELSQALQSSCEVPSAPRTPPLVCPEQGGDAGLRTAQQHASASGDTRVQGCRTCTRCARSTRQGRGACPALDELACEQKSVLSKAASGLRRGWTAGLCASRPAGSSLELPHWVTCDRQRLPPWGWTAAVHGEGGLGCIPPAS